MLTFSQPQISLRIASLSSTLESFCRLAMPQHMSAFKEIEGEMRWLVLLCARSIFPNIYLSRAVWFDTPLSSILLSRTLACFAELAWVTQAQTRKPHALGRRCRRV